MGKVSSLSFFFPAFNEEADVEPLIRQAQQVLPEVAHNWEIIPVNDGSTDGTGAIFSHFEAEDPEHVHPVHHEVNRGYGAAVISGFKKSRFDYVFFTDGDRQFDLSELPLLIDAIDDGDMAIGFRKNRRDPFGRKLNGFLWGMLVKMLFGIKARDVNCAFKLIKRTVMERVILSSKGAMVSTELLAKARKEGFRIAEIGVTHFPRTAGKQTGSNWHVITQAFLELFTLYRDLK